MEPHTVNFKKALGSIRPNEKRLGKAISPPACERGVPLYPLRYGIADYAWDREVFPRLNTEGYPALTAGKAYGLRTLRPGTYVYLFHFENGRMWTQHYQVTEDVRFARIWWSDADDDDATPGRLSRPDTVGAQMYLFAPEAKTAETVHILVSDTLLSHRTLWAIETNDGGLRDALSTQCRPAGNAYQEHIFDATLLGEAAPELVSPSGHGAPKPFDWSEIQFSETAPNHHNIQANMYLALLPRKDFPPLVVALQDPIGIASELHYRITRAVTRKTEYAGRNAHKLQSATLIRNYFEGMKKEAGRNPDVANTITRQQNLVNYSGAMSFPGVYAKEIAAFDSTSAAAVADSVAWVRLIDPSRLLGKALRCFDRGVIHNAHDYEDAVLQCIGGLVHAKDGIQVLNDLINLPVDKSPYWLALANGSELLLARLKSSSGEIAKNLFNVLDKAFEQHQLTTASNALIGLLQALPETKAAEVLVPRLRHVMEIRAGFTIVRYDVGIDDLQRAAYEFQGYQTLGEDGLRGWKMPSPTISPADSGKRTSVYDWVKVGETTYREIDAAMANGSPLPLPRAVQMEGNPFINMLNRVHVPAGHLFTGLGGLLAIKGIKDSLKSASSPNSEISSDISLLAAFYTLVGAGIEIHSSISAIRFERRGNILLANSAKIFAAKFGVAIFGAGGAGLAAIADVVRAIKAFDESNSEQGKVLLWSALAGGTLALAMGAGGVATVASIAAGAPILVLGLTPWGWALVAAGAFIGGLALSVGVNMTTHRPVEIWLKHSAWGVSSRSYSNQEELDAVHSLLYRPRLSVEWDKPSGYSVGQLRISCQLPGSNDIPGEKFQTKLAFTLNGSRLAPIEGPIAYAPGTIPVDYRHECLVTRLGARGSECGWSIQMHEDAKVALEYLYFPDPDSRPDIALRQPHAPTPLQFSSGGWLSDPISSALLEPIRSPSNV
ncbi:toxin VasX [Achromobacter mucicolens]|uniref:toxin VasX n=1 Tax=Achromobacter mucicolens TaxID=1389922 RepID=UPI0011B22811|nr:toxin VasX [Achromobacter mucicolens]